MATGNVVATVRRQGETKEEQKARMGQQPAVQPGQLTADDLQTMFGGQADLLRLINSQGQVNPETGTRQIVRRNMDGSIVDPNAPTGLDWVTAFGPDSPDPARQELMQRRQERVDGYASPVTRAQAGYDAVQRLKQAQINEGLRGPEDENAPNRAGQTIQTPGSDVRVAYDAFGQPVGFSGATMPNAPVTSGGQPIGGFTNSEQQSFRNMANNLAANQSVYSDAFEGGGNATVPTGTPAPQTPVVSQQQPTGVPTSTTPLVQPDYTKALGYQLDPGQKPGLLDYITAGVRYPITRYGRNVHDTAINSIADFVSNLLGLNSVQPPKQPRSAPPSIIQEPRDEFGYPAPRNY